MLYICGYLIIQIVLVEINFWSLLKQMVLACLIYSFLILCLGYEFGNGDQTEFIPLLRDNIEAGYFGKDFFVQNYLSYGHKVRDGIVWLSNLGLQIMPLAHWYFLLHFIFSLSLICGGMAILSVFTRNKALIICALCAIWGLMFGINLGSNEIYYAQLVPSLIAKSFLIWSIYFYIKDKITLWPIFIIIGSLWQDMAALQLLLLLTASSFIMFLVPLFRRKKELPGLTAGGHLFRTIKPWNLLFFLLFISAFLFLKWDLLFRSDPSQDMTGFINILLWRVGHHFDPALFPVKNYIIFGIGVVFALTILLKRNLHLFVFCFLAILGCITYAVAYRIYPEIVLTQWFKTTIWVKLICFGAVFIFMMELILKMFAKHQKLNIQAAFLTAVLIIGIYKGPLHQAPYQLPFTPSKANDEINIALLAAEKTPKDALFLIPPDNSTFKIWAKRSCWIDYKSTVFDAGVLQEWLERISLVYGINLQDQGGLNAYPAMRAGYAHFLQDPLNLTKIGVTHVVTEEVLPQYQLLGEMGRWRLYGIK